MDNRQRCKNEARQATGAIECLGEVVCQIKSMQAVFSQLLLLRPDWQSSRCCLSWKVKTMNSGRLYPKLLAGNNSFNILPTVLAADSTRNGEQVQGRRKLRLSGHQYSANLCDLAKSNLLPTPTTREYKGGRHPDSLLKAGRTATNSLGDAINTIAGSCVKLNPLFVAEMMGFPLNWTLEPFQKNYFFKRPEKHII